jgi:hypothetical protein
MFRIDDCTVSFRDEQIARQYGVLLVTFSDDFTAILISVQNGKVIRTGDQIWVKYEAKKYEFPVLFEVEFKSFYTGADYKESEYWLGISSFRYEMVE